MERENDGGFSRKLRRERGEEEEKVEAGRKEKEIQTKREFTI